MKRGYSLLLLLFLLPGLAGCLSLSPELRRDNADQPAGHDDSRPAAARQDSPDNLKSKDTAKPADQEKTVDKSQAAESASESTGEEETKKKASANKNQPSGDTKSKKKETQEDVPPEDIPF